MDKQGLTGANIGLSQISMQGKNRTQSLKTIRNVVHRVRVSKELIGANLTY